MGMIVGLVQIARGHKGVAWLRSSRTDEVVQNRGVSARYCLLILLSLPIIGMVAATTLGLDQQFGLDMLRQHHLQLLGFVATEPALAASVFIGIYFGAAASSVPGIGVLTAVGGFLFGWWWGAIYSMLAATTAGVSAETLADAPLPGSNRHSGGPRARTARNSIRNVPATAPSTGQRLERTRASLGCTSLAARRTMCALT